MRRTPVQACICVLLTLSSISGTPNANPTVAPLVHSAAITTTTDSKQTALSNFDERRAVHCAKGICQTWQISPVLQKLGSDLILNPGVNGPMSVSTVTDGGVVCYVPWLDVSTAGTQNTVICNSLMLDTTGPNGVYLSKGPDLVLVGFSSRRTVTVKTTSINTAVVCAGSYNAGSLVCSVLSITTGSLTKTPDVYVGNFDPAYMSLGVSGSTGLVCYSDSPSATYCHSLAISLSPNSVTGGAAVSYFPSSYQNRLKVSMYGDTAVVCATGYYYDAVYNPGSLGNIMCVAKNIVSGLLSSLFVSQPTSNLGLHMVSASFGMLCYAVPNGVTATSTTINCFTLQYNGQLTIGTTNLLDFKPGSALGMSTALMPIGSTFPVSVNGLMCDWNQCRSMVVTPPAA